MDTEICVLHASGEIASQIIHFLEILGVSYLLTHAEKPLPSFQKSDSRQTPSEASSGILASAFTATQSRVWSTTFLISMQIDFFLQTFFSQSIKFVQIGSFPNEGTSINKKPRILPRPPQKKGILEEETTFDGRHRHQLSISRVT